MLESTKDIAIRLRAAGLRFSNDSLAEHMSQFTPAYKAGSIKVYETDVANAAFDSFYEMRKKKKQPQLSKDEQLQMQFQTQLDRIEEKLDLLLKELT